MSRAFVFRYDTAIVQDLEHIDRKHHEAIRDAILAQLQFEPLRETRNRKPLDPPIREARWELRCGPNNRFRVIYSVVIEEDEEAGGIVQILGIGEKRGSRLWLSGEEIDP